MADREEVLQAVLDKLWSSAHEYGGADLNECGNPTPGSRERWQKYAEELLLRWLEYQVTVPDDDWQAVEA